MEIRDGQPGSPEPERRRLAWSESERQTVTSSSGRTMKQMGGQSDADVHETMGLYFTEQLT